MIREMAVAFCRVTGVEPSREQIAQVELEIRHHFGGERVYVASHPKAQHQAIAAKLMRQANRPRRDVAAEMGMSERGLRKALRGR